MKGQRPDCIPAQRNALGVEKNDTFRWKDRSDYHRAKTLTLPGVEFVRRYLRHVLPQGLRSMRYYGFCHPTAKASRLRVQFLAGSPVQFGSASSPADRAPQRCPNCGGPARLLKCFRPPRRERGPPANRPSLIFAFA